MTHCGRFTDAPLSRREMLRTAAGGFGAVALAALSCERSFGEIASTAHSQPHGAAVGLNALRFPPKARNVIFLYMDGGPSQVDTFDPKPRLDKEHGQPFKMKMEPTQFNNNGNTLGSPVEVPPVRPKRHAGQRPVSARRPAASTIWRSSARWSSKFSEHTNANYFLHTGQRPAGPAEHGRLGHVWPGKRVPQSARLRRAQRRADSARRARQFQQRLSAGHVSGRRSSSRKPSRWRTSAAASREPELQQQQAGAVATARSAGARSRWARRSRSNRRSPTTSWRYRMQIGGAGADRISRARRRRRGKLYGLDSTNGPTRIYRAAMPAGAAARRAWRAVRRTDLSQIRATTAGTSTAT